MRYFAEMLEDMSQQPAIAAHPSVRVLIEAASREAYAAVASLWDRLGTVLDEVDTSLPRQRGRACNQSAPPVCKDGKPPSRDLASIETLSGRGSARS